MEKENPLIEFAKALARWQAKEDAESLQPSNDDVKPATPAKRSK
ncbi:hypothetical protein [Agrobacterium tumefaciens]